MCILAEWISIKLAIGFLFLSDFLYKLGFETTSHRIMSIGDDIFLYWHPECKDDLEKL